MRPRSSLAFVGVAVALCTATGQALACPACGGGTMPKRVLDVYLFVTVMLSAIPLLFAAIIASWAHRARHDDDDAR